jgi:hypothetical protein
MKPNTFRQSHAAQIPGFFLLALVVLQRDPMIVVAACFDDAGADKEVLARDSGIGFGAHLSRCSGLKESMAWSAVTRFDLTFVQQFILVEGHPAATV